MKPMLKFNGNNWNIVYKYTAYKIQWRLDIPSNARATLDKQPCVITPTFVYHDQWSFVKADHTTILKTYRLNLKSNVNNASRTRQFQI